MDPKPGSNMALPNPDLSPMNNVGPHKAVSLPNLWGTIFVSSGITALGPLRNVHKLSS
jgi:hypothetical protein